MGLDQWAGAFVPGDDIESFEGEESLGSWRKHPNLQGWMELLFKLKGGKGSFNGVSVELTLSDLDMLEHAVDQCSLPETSGFFFGDNADAEYKDQDLQFIKDARQAIGDGKSVYYMASF